jgi:hypothetical protein
LGDFSPIGQLFTLGGFLKIAKEAQNFGLIFTAAKAMHKFWQEMGWAAFLGRFFSQTHLVTLQSTDTLPLGGAVRRGQMDSTFSILFRHFLASWTSTFKRSAGFSWTVNFVEGPLA